MITPAYVRTMAAYNSEMNRRLYEAASRLSDAARKQDRGAFWGSLHRTLTHILYGDRAWMSRFADWEKPTVPLKESADWCDDFAELKKQRYDADRRIAHQQCLGSHYHPGSAVPTLITVTRNKRRLHWME